MMSAERQFWMKLQLVGFAVGFVLVTATGSAWGLAVPGVLAFGRLAYIIGIEGLDR